MSTKVGLLNSTEAVWNDRDFYAMFKDFIETEGGGFVNTDRALSALVNPGFEQGTGIISADDWIGSDKFNAWWGEIQGTATIEFDAVIFDSGLQSILIDQTVNGGTDETSIRPTENDIGALTAEDLLHLIPIKDGKTYRLAFALQTVGVSSGASGGARVRMRAVDENGDLVGTEAVSTFVTGSQAFTDDTLDIVAADGAKYLLVEAQMINETGEARFDTLSVTERGDSCRVTAEVIPTADIDIATGASYFEITDLSANVFLVRFEVTGAEQATISNNVSGLDRIDLVYLQYDNSVTPDATSSNVGTIVVAIGTPAASPVAPALPANAIALAEIFMANGATIVTESQITDLRDQLTWRNMEVANSTSDNQPISRGEAIRPATEAQLGMAVLSDPPTDPARPVVVEENFPGLLTEAEKLSLLAGQPFLGDNFTFGENVLEGMNVAMESDGNVYMTRPIETSDPSNDLVADPDDIDQALNRNGYKISNTRVVSVSVFQSGVDTVEIKQFAVDPLTGAVTGVQASLTVNPGVNVQHIDSVMLDANTMLIVYAYSGNVDGVIVENLDGTATVGAPQSLSAASSSGVACMQIGASATDAILVRSTSGTGLVSIDLAISGTTITPGTTSTMFSTTDSLTIWEGHQFGDTDFHIVLFNNGTGSASYAIAGQWSIGSNDFSSVGTEITISNADYTLSGRTFSDTGLAAVYTQTTSGTIRMSTITRSTVALTNNAATTFWSNGGSRAHIEMLGSHHGMISLDENSNSRGRTQIFEVDPVNEDTIIALGTFNEWGNNNDDQLIIMPWLESKIVAQYWDFSASNQLAGVMDLTNNFDGYVGVVSADVDTGVDPTEAVRYSGRSDITIDTLTPGTRYFTGISGGFSTNEPDQAGTQPIGNSVGANSILIRD